MGPGAHIFSNRWYKEWIPKFSGVPHEESEEAIVLMNGRTTEPFMREGSLLHPCQARRYVTVHGMTGSYPTTPHHKYHKPTAM